MKQIFIALLATSLSMPGFAQEDSTKKEKADTIRIGGMIIIKDGKDSSEKESTDIIISAKKKTYKPSNVSTNWWIVDLGFANVNDNTNYSAAQSSGFVGAGVGRDQMKLKSGKSVNVNIWVFMQKVNLVKHVVNLKYGLGVELNNYHFDDERIRFDRNPTFIHLDESYRDLGKNKLAADYLTVPVLLNFNFTPKRHNSFGISGGISAGYLYSARQKIKRGDDKDKLHDDFDLEKFKLSYIGEVGLGRVKLYGSYAMKNMWDKGLDQTPYSVGIRFSRF